MILSFRWYGRNDPISLQYIRQIPEMRSVVTALYDIPAGKLWPMADLLTLKQEIETAVLSLDVIESLPIHEDIKLGRSNRDQLIDIYCQNIIRLGQIGVSVICYNFMPLFDWFRTDLEHILPDGSHVMAFDQQQIANAPDPWTANWPAYFPLDEPPEKLKRAYQALTEAELRDNLAYFLNGIIPTAEAAGINMALHPDDPPWSIFNLPRIVKNRADLARILDCVDSPANGLTFCTGSLGANSENDLPAMIREFGHRIHFAHCRNVKRTGEYQFSESAHPHSFGDVNLVDVMQAYQDINFTGPMRPDHGRSIWGEKSIPGYGLYDRALGATYLLGVWHALTR